MEPLIVSVMARQRGRFISITWHLADCHLRIINLYDIWPLSIFLSPTDVSRNYQNIVMPSKLKSPMAISQRIHGSNFLRSFSKATFFPIGYAENKSIAQHLLLVNEAQAAVLVPNHPQIQNNNKLEAVVNLNL